MSQSEGAGAPSIVRERADELFAADRDRNHTRTSRLFAVLMGVQWLFGIVIAVTLSPYAWEGRVRTIHEHVLVAVVLGGVLTSLPAFLAITRPAWVGTRHVIACAQMLWSALLIHLTGGRIETHFHVFGSLAFLAFYRDWRVLVPATIVVAGDHFARGMFWPESVYGVDVVQPWRFIEHAGWVVFEDVILVLSCVRGVEEMRRMAMRQADVELLSEHQRQKSRELAAALARLEDSKDALVRNERLAAVGQLAASVGHELRNPLAAVRNAATYIGKRLGDPKATTPTDPKVMQFLGLIERELVTMTRIISDLLDFARERKPELQPCPVRPLVDDAVALVPSTSVRIVNAVPNELPVPDLDREQFRQVFINLIQNGVEAIAADSTGEVTVRADGGELLPWRITVSDTGHGMSPEVVAKIFEPLYTTKVKGTGLGLAVVSNLIRGNGGSIRVETEPGRGTSFLIELPPRGASREAGAGK